MKFKSILKLSFLNLKRRKLRTFLTTLGVSVAIGTLFFLVNTAESIKGQITTLTLKFSDSTRIQVFERVEFNFGAPAQPATSSANKKINDKAIQDLRKLPNVRGAYPELSIPVAEYTLVNKKEATSSATYPRVSLKEDEESLRLVFGNEGYMKEGEFFRDNEQNAIVVTEELAKKTKAKVGETLVIKMENSLADPTKPDQPKKTLGEFEAKVVGIAKDPKFDQSVPVDSRMNLQLEVLISFALAEDIYKVAPVDESIPAEFRPKAGEYFTAVVFADKIENVRAVEKSIKDAGYDAFSVFSQLDAINVFFLIVQAILGGFSIVGIIVALIGISNTMFMSVLERTKEIGILKAMGAKDKDIEGLFVTEAAAFGFFGAVFGIVVSSVIGFILAFVANFLAQSQIKGLASGAPPEVAKELVVRYNIDPQILLLTLAGATVLAIVAGLIPARRASQLDPIQALKYE